MSTLKAAYNLNCVMEDNKSSDLAMGNERYDLKILRSLRKIIRSVDLHSRKLSMHYDITAPQLITLLAVSEQGPMTTAAIAKEVHLSASTLVGIIDRLEAKGFIQRERSTEDRRQVIISITSEGHAFVKKAPSPLQETLANALEKTTPLEQATISLALEKIVKLIEAEEIDAAPILQTGAIDDKK